MITANDVLRYLCDVLNIANDNKLLIQDIMFDLKEIEDLEGFRGFIKSEFMNEQYKYYSGIQKFLALKKNFLKTKIVKLTVDQQYKANAFSENLFKKVCDVFEFIEWEVQTGLDLHSKKVDELLRIKFGNEPKELKVLEQIGKRGVLLNYMRKKEDLREKIKEVVVEFTLLKHNPQIAIKNKEQLLLEKLNK